MGCKSCEKKRLIRNIAAGFGRLITEEVLDKEPPSWVLERARICSTCEHRTFLGIAKWAINFVAEGDLPINHNPGRFDRLWCSICKCCLEAAIRAKQKECAAGLWPKQEGK